MKKRLSRAERRQQIVEASLHIIAEQGLRSFTTAAVASEVGLAEGSIFRHFTSKEEIVGEVIRYAGELLTAEIPPPSADPVERLRQFLLARVRLIRERPGLFRILFSDQLSQAASERDVEAVEALKRRSFGFVRECLDEASRRGMLAEGVDPAVLFLVVRGMALSLVFTPSAKWGPEAPEPERVWGTLARLVFRATES